MLFVAGQWMDEKLDLLQENTQTITSNTSYILQSDYMGKYSSGAVLMIYNNISQASEILDGDFFVINDKGEIVYCKEILKNTSMMQDGECLIHSNYEIPDYVMDTIKKGETYSRSVGFAFFNGIHNIIRDFVVAVNQALPVLHHGSIL